jgi:hypothetical protein
MGTLLALGRRKSAKQLIELHTKLTMGLSRLGFLCCINAIVETA